MEEYNDEETDPLVRLKLKSFKEGYILVTFLSQRENVDSNYTYHTSSYLK